MQQQNIFLLGKWKGTGVVLDNGMEYDEELEFTVFRTTPAVVINQRSMTWKSADKAPMHVEQGFVKLLPPDSQKVEASFTHAFSLNEFTYGTLVDQRLTLETEGPQCFQRGKVARGKTTTYLKREYWLNEKGNLVYNIYLGVDGNNPYLHLKAELVKQQ